jgi:DNA adenine methylase
MSKLLSSDVNVKPFLRWAGGKNWLIKHLSEILPKAGYNNYHEPFLGSGAVFLSLQPLNKSYLSDLNKELIAVYKTLKRDPHSIVKCLKRFENTEDFYYEIREKSFDDPAKAAAKFIYLNQTSFNGIYRVNLKGEYNVPFGYRTKEFLDEEALLRVSASLRRTSIFDGDFDDIRDNIQKKDLVFLDPPYTVSHNNNGFIKYNQKLFSLKDQERLSRLIDYIKRKGAFYVLTNAAHYRIIEIFEKGDTKLELSRASLIGGKQAKRGHTSEFIFTNAI